MIVYGVEEFGSMCGCRKSGLDKKVGVEKCGKVLV